MAEPVSPPVARPSGLRQRVRRWGAGADELEAADLRLEAQELGATTITECCMGERVTVAGTLRTVTLRPVGGVPALEAGLYDGSASLHVVWLGRRRIAGVVPGASIVVHGRVTSHSGMPTIFNPSYELHA